MSGGSVTMDDDDCPATCFNNTCDFYDDYMGKIDGVCDFNGTEIEVYGCDCTGCACSGTTAPTASRVPTGSPGIVTHIHTAKFLT